MSRIHLENQMKKIKIEFKIPDEQMLDMGELREAALSELDRQNVVPDSESFSCGKDDDEDEDDGRPYYPRERGFFGFD